MIAALSMPCLTPMYYQYVRNHEGGAVKYNFISSKKFNSY